MAIDGMDDWIKKLETMKKDFPKEAGRFLMMKANETIEYVKKYPGHKSPTGTLRGVWFRENGGSFRQIIYNNTSYAAHVEYGHRTRLGTGKKSSKLYRKDGTPTVRFVKGYRMLHRGLNRTKLSFYRDLEVVYKNLISR